MRFIPRVLNALLTLVVMLVFAFAFFMVVLYAQGDVDITPLGPWYEKTTSIIPLPAALIIVTIGLVVIVAKLTQYVSEHGQDVRTPGFPLTRKHKTLSGRVPYD